MPNVWDLLQCNREERQQRQAAGQAAQAAQRHSGAVRNGETAPTSKRRRVESEPEAQCGHPAAVAAENSSDDEWMPNVWDLLGYNRGRPKKTSKRQAPVRRRQAGKTAESSSDGVAAVLDRRLAAVRPRLNRDVETPVTTQNSL